MPRHQAPWNESAGHGFLSIAADSRIGRTTEVPVNRGEHYLRCPFMADKSIQISEDTYNRLAEIATPGAEHDAIICTLVEDFELHATMRHLRIAELLAAARGDASAVEWAERELDRLVESPDVGATRGFVLDETVLIRLARADLRVVALVDLIGQRKQHLMVPVVAQAAAQAAGSCVEESLLVALVRTLPTTNKFDVSITEDLVKWASWKRAYGPEWDYVSAFTAMVAADEELTILTADLGRWGLAVGGVVPPTTPLFELKLLDA